MTDIIVSPDENTKKVVEITIKTEKSTNVYKGEKAARLARILAKEEPLLLRWINRFSTLR